MTNPDGVVASRSLDDPSLVEAGDPRGMVRTVATTGDQLVTGFELGRTTPGLPLADGVTSVVLSGMGGSGVAGDVIRTVLGSRAAVPFVSQKGYALPEFCDRTTVVVASSFSGNTEETVGVYAQAVARECRVVAISAGGELAALAEADGTPRVGIPADVAMPRAALGYLLGATLGVLDALGLVPAAEAVNRVVPTLRELAGRLGPDRTTADNEAKAVAQWLGRRIPVVWGSEGPAEAAATRWKTQINENAKLPAFAGVLPELDHNDVEGWSEDSGSPFGLVVLRHDLEHPRVAARVPATLDAIAAAGLEAREVWAPPGSSGLGAALGLIMLGDFASTYLAILRGVDPTPIPVLLALKERLRALEQKGRGA